MDAVADSESSLDSPGETTLAKHRGVSASSITAQERVEALRARGYGPAETDFLCLAALHSGTSFAGSSSPSSEWDEGTETSYWLAS